MNNTIYLRRKGKLYLDKGDNSLSDDYMFNLLKNIEGFGYTFSPELVDVVRTLSVDRLKSFYKQLIVDLRESLGAHVVFKPMYPNFPEQVRDATDEELYSNAFWHYLGDWIGRRIMPRYEKKVREGLKDRTELKVIGLGSNEDFNSIFTRLLGSKTSISDADRQDVEWFVKNYNNKVFELTPVDMPLKENVAFFLGCLLKNDLEVETQFNKYVKTATDVLRIATAISDGDVSLAENTRYKSISKRNRKLLLSSLEKIGNITEDMLRYKNRWKRLGEKLHPFEFKNRFPKCCEAFDVLRNDKPFSTFNGRVEQALLNGDVRASVNLLKTRPGELARRLDKLLRMSTHTESVISEFRQVAEIVSSPVLLQVQTHFKHRNLPKDLRTFFPKGNIGKVRSINNDLPNIDKSVCDEIVLICEDALVQRFRMYKPLGSVFIDERLKDYTVPFAQRSASKVLKTISRGSRMDLPLGDTLRLFIYWRDGDNRTDLDLSALALDTDSGYKLTLAYYNLKDLGGYHSGDITSAPQGASEFIDIEIPKCLEHGIRYVVMSVNSYTNQLYCDLPVCFAGFMIRQFPNSGEIYEPRDTSKCCG